MTLKSQATGIIPIEKGVFKMIAYAKHSGDPSPHFALVNDTFDAFQPVIVRIHSECITGDVFGSLRCDCGEQLAKSLEIISEQGGILIYLRQEGRGIGIINKLKAYNLQDEGVNTADANVHLGFEVDERNYEMGRDILKDLGIKKIKLLTNNPEKITAFNGSDIEVVERIELEITPRHENRKYLETKKKIMGHMLKL